MLDRTKPYAHISPPYRGAVYKQPPTPGGLYYDQQGHEVDTSVLTEKRGGTPVSTGPVHMATVSDDGLLANIDGVNFVRQDVARKEVENAKAARRQAEIDDVRQEAPEQAAPPQESPPDDRQDDLARDIKGIGPKIAADLEGVGIASLLDLASVDRDQRELLSTNHGLVIADTWVQQATALLAERHPEIVSQSEPPPVSDSGITKQDLIAWGKGQKQFLFEVIRKAVFQYCSARVTNETDAMSTLIRDGLITQDQAGR